MREVTRTTVTSAGKIRVAKDGSITTGTSRNANKKKNTTRVDITRSTERTPLTHDSENTARSGQKDKPVTILRAVRKAASAVSGRSRAFTPRSQETDNGENKDESVMSVIDALEEVLDTGDDDDDCCVCPNGWTVLIVVVLTTTIAAFAIETNLLAYVAPCAVAEFSSADDYDTIADLEYSLWDAAYYGNMLGCFIIGPMADIIGRWRVLMFSSVVVVISGLLSALSISYRMLWWTRFFVGFGEGGCIVSESLIAEFVIPSYRGSIMNISAVGWGIGSVSVSLLAKYTVPYYGYKMFMFYCIVPYVVTCFGLCFLVESPVWLLEQGHHNKALEALRTIAKRNGSDMPCERLSLPDNFHKEDEAKGRIFSVRFFIYVKRWIKGYRLLFSKVLYKRTLLAGFLAFWCYFSYSATVIYNDDVVSMDDGLLCDFDYDTTIFYASAEVIAPIFIFGIIDKKNIGIFGGRFGSQWIPYTLGTLCLVGTSWARSTLSLKILTYVSRGSIMAATAVTFIYFVEIIPTRNRATGLCLDNIISVFGATFGAYWGYSGYSADAVAFGIGVSCFLCILPLLVLPETVGTNLEDLDREDADLSVGCSCRKMKNCCGDDDDEPEN